MSEELERLANGCLLPGFAGVTPPDWVRRELEAGLGGVVLFSRNVRDPEQVAALTAAVRSVRPDVVVATDEEGGDVTRLAADGGSSYPGNWALGAVDDVALTERVAAAIAGDLMATGVNLDFAPVADVNTNPQNPVIGVRSFGADAALVARHVAAFVRGLQGGGVAACAKHFPGHGATELDSHLELPTVAAVELAPFQAAIDAGVQSIMTAHIRVPAIDDQPATLSRRLLTDVLRGELGFRGMVVTDALEMRALSSTLAPGEAAVRALAAGADALCLGHDLGEHAVQAVRDAVVAAVRSGRLAEERVADAAARVTAVAKWASRPGRRPDADAAVGLEAARRALVAEGNVELSSAPLVVELWPAPSLAAGKAGHGLGDALRSRVPETEVLRLDRSAVEPPADDRPLVLVVRDAHRHGWQQDLAEAVLAARPDTVVVETGLPEWRPAAAAGYVATLGGGRVNLEAAAERLAALA
jgi:beta-N-acetylhexosaminidase